MGDPKTEIYFSNLVNDINGNFSRYIYFYMSYLIEQNRISDASNLVSDIDYINATLLLAQGKAGLIMVNTIILVNYFHVKITKTL